jgi:hypothetical protein
MPFVMGFNSIEALHRKFVQAKLDLDFTSYFSSLDYMRRVIYRC